MEKQPENKNHISDEETDKGFSNRSLYSEHFKGADGKDVHGYAREDQLLRHGDSINDISKVSILIDTFSYFFFWLSWFYPKAKHIPLSHQLYFFFQQKILRKHGAVPWPVNKNSVILHWQNIAIGNRCAPGMNAFCYIQAKNGIIFGNNIRIGPGVGIISAGHNPDNYDQHIKSGPICIGNNVWIGMNSVILPGVSIGDNVVIGAGSIVNSHIPSNSIAAGNPCKVVKKKGPYRGLEYNK